MDECNKNNFIPIIIHTLGELRSFIIIISSFRQHDHNKDVTIVLSMEVFCVLEPEGEVSPHFTTPTSNRLNISRLYAFGH